MNYPAKHITRFLLASLAALLPLAGQAGAPCDLRCEFFRNPMGIEEPTPALSWKLDDPRTGAKQTAYQIQSASSPEKLGQPDLWDSGRQSSCESHLVPYFGKPLTSSQRVYWRVQVWGQDGKPSDWSQPACFETGLLRKEDWRAQWIACAENPVVRNEFTGLWVRYAVQVGRSSEQDAAAMALLTEAYKPSPLFRKEFHLTSLPSRARLHIAAVGYAEIFINGKRVGDRLLDPAYTHYDSHALYVTHDILPYLQKGTNAITVLLGPGWRTSFYNISANPEKALYGDGGILAQLMFFDERGIATTLGSDPTWKTAPSGLLKSQLFIGEVLDLRENESAKSLPGYDDAHWIAAVPLAEPPPELHSMQMPPERAVRTVSAKSCWQTAPGVWTYDLGEHISGWARIQIASAGGKPVIVRYGQALDPGRSRLYYPADSLPDESARKINGANSQEMHGGSKSMAASLFVPQAGADAVLENKFAYFSFRYIEISGLETALPVGQVAGVVVHSDLPLTGTFESSSEMLNRVYAACANTMIYCSHGVYQDNICQERGGYNIIRGQAITAFNYLYDAALFHDKYFADLRSQITAGKPPVQAPTKRRALGADLPGDHTFAVVSPWRTYVAFGDRRALAKNIEMMDQFLTVYAKDFSTNIENLRGWGEWGDNFIGTGNRPPTPNGDHFQIVKGKAAAPAGGYGPLNTPTVLEVALKMYRAYALFGRVAEAAGKPELKDKYTAIAKQGRDQILAKFYNAEKKTFGSQAADALALEVGICDEQDRAGVAASLISDFENVWSNRVSAGYAVNSLPSVMSANGYPDAALKVFTSTNAPGFAWFIENGLTTIPARWAVDPWPKIPDARLCQAEKPGAIQWCFNGLGGIVPDESAPGFKHFFLAPVFPKDLESAKVGFESAYGRISSEWEQKEASIRWRVVVPPNTTATVKLPAFKKITLNGKSVAKNEFELAAGMWEILLNKSGAIK